MLTTERHVSCQDTIERLRLTSRSLQEQLEKLDASLAKIADAINEVQVEYWHARFVSKPRFFVNEEENQGARSNVPMRSHHELGYCCIGSKWQFALREVHAKWVPELGEYTVLHESEPFPLVRASRSHRISAAEHVEDLLDGLYDHMVDLEQKSVVIQSQLSCAPAAFQRPKRFERQDPPAMDT